MEKTFKVILFSIPHFDSIYHYTSDTLPLLGDIIELERARTHFKITETFLLPTSIDDMAYILLGSILGKHISVATFKNLKYRINRTSNLNIEANSYGEIIFPCSLN